MMIVSSLIVSLVLAGSYRNAQNIICAYFPDECRYTKQIAPPHVKFKKGTWFNWRQLRFMRGEIDFDKRLATVSTKGGLKGIAKRYEHESLHWLVRFFVKTHYHRSQRWVDRYWRKGL
jgi:hypothetical protein